MEDEEEGEEDEGRDDEGADDGGSEENSFIKEFNQKWGWISSIDAVAKTINTDWDTVFNKGVVEFLNILSYSRDKAELEKLQMKDFQNKMKNKRVY
jgi:hypothetical protein